MTIFRHAVFVAAARALNALFFLAIAAYGVLAYSSFAYERLIKPAIIPAVTDFVSMSPALFWLTLLITVLTLFPRLQRPSRSRAAVAYVMTWTTVGVSVAFRPVLAALGGGPSGLIVALLALAAPVSLAIVDHILLPPLPIAPVDARRASVSILGAGLLAWAVYAVAVPLRLRQAIGISFSPGELIVALAGSAAAVVSTFAAVSLMVLAMLALLPFRRSRGIGEYWGLIVLLGATLAGVLYGIVCASIAFRGVAAALSSSALGAAAAIVWADLARVRVTSVDRRPIDAFALFVAPVVGYRSHRRRAIVAWATALPIVAFALVNAVEQLDWNFLLQKLSVLAVWLLAVAIVHAAAHETGRSISPSQAMLAPALVLAACAIGSLTLSRGYPKASGRLDAESVLDRYAAVDPSYRLIRDTRTVPSGETARFYAYLRANTLVSPAAARPAAIDFVSPLRATESSKPLIFLFVVDSLRRDYLSPYNSAVSFTPKIARFASDSVVFDRAFTRYAGTALAVPSIWAGGMLIHELEEHEFAPRNALLKLLDVDGYHPVLTMDFVVNDLVPHRADVTELDPGLKETQIDLCRTTSELETMLNARTDQRPMFVYTLPQNVHIAVASKRKPPAGETYPGFFAPVASSVRAVDGCFGGFIDFLKRAGLYDRSLIVLTSDHGDSLGEGGRWGHAYFMYPEVMRVPLIIHLPSSLRGRASVDPDAVAFSTDITPTLYALLGHEPADLGPLFGRPLFGLNGAAAPAPRQNSFLLASSYGAVYGVLRNNGTLLYTSDAEDARDFAFDLGGSGPGVQIALTADTIAENRRLIREQLSRLAALNHFTP